MPASNPGQVCRFNFQAAKVAWIFLPMGEYRVFWEGISVRRAETSFHRIAEVGLRSQNAPTDLIKFPLYEWET